MKLFQKIRTLLFSVVALATPMLCAQDIPELPILPIESGLCVKLSHKNPNDQVWILDRNDTWIWPTTKTESYMTINNSDSAYTINAYQWVNNGWQLSRTVQCSNASSCPRLRCIQNGEWVDCANALNITTEICTLPCDRAATECPVDCKRASTECSVNCTRAANECPISCEQAVTAIGVCPCGDQGQGVYTCNTDMVCPSCPTLNCAQCAVDCKRASTECGISCEQAVTAIGNCPCGTGGQGSYVCDVDVQCPELDCAQCPVTCEQAAATIGNCTCGAQGQGSYVCDVDMQCPELNCAQCPVTCEQAAATIGNCTCGAQGQGSYICDVDVQCPALDCTQCNVNCSRAATECPVNCMRINECEIAPVPPPPGTSEPLPPDTSEPLPSAPPPSGAAPPPPPPPPGTP